MGWFSKNKSLLGADNSVEHWGELNDLQQLEEIISDKKTTWLIFKHSTRCSVSKMVFNRLLKEWNTENKIVNPVYLDLLSYRSLSDAVANTFGVKHESPQILIIRNGDCIYSASHTAITAKEIINFLENNPD